MNSASKTFSFTLLSLLVSSAAFADDHKPKVDVSGFIRFDYGAGDRYPEDEGEDRTGISKAALALTGQQDNIKGVLVVGTEALTTDNPSDDGNVDVKDAFIVIENVEGSALTLSLGAQPLLFGLKPNSYPGDHSLQESIEYGSVQGSVNVAGQANFSVISRFKINDSLSIESGIFDQDSAPGATDSFEDEGSTIIDNAFTQLRVNNLNGSGFYGVVGVETVYLEADDDNYTIVDLGVGFNNGLFDISAEWISIEEELAVAAAQRANIFGLVNDDETYFVVESSVKVAPKVSLYADWASADELDVDTIRIGADYFYHPSLKLSAEYSVDDSDIEALDVDSFDVRVAYSF